MEASFLNVSNVVAEVTSLGVVHRHRCFSDIVDCCRVSVGEHGVVEELLTVGGKLHLQDFLHSCEVKFSRCQSLLLKRLDVLDSLRTETVVTIWRFHSHMPEN
jgi:hypothetical protein